MVDVTLHSSVRPNAHYVDMSSVEEYTFLLVINLYDPDIWGANWMRPTPDGNVNIMVNDPNIWSGFIVSFRESFSVFNDPNIWGAKER